MPKLPNRNYQIGKLTILTILLKASGLYPSQAPDIRSGSLTLALTGILVDDTIAITPPMCESLAFKVLQDSSSEGDVDTKWIRQPANPEEWRNKASKESLTAALQYRLLKTGVGFASWELTYKPTEMLVPCDAVLNISYMLLVDRNELFFESKMIKGVLANE